MAQSDFAGLVDAVGADVVVGVFDPVTAGGGGRDSACVGSMEIIGNQFSVMVGKMIDTSALG